MVQGLVDRLGFDDFILWFHAGTHFSAVHIHEYETGAWRVNCAVKCVEKYCVQIAICSWKGNASLRCELNMYTREVKISCSRDFLHFIETSSCPRLENACHCHDIYAYRPTILQEHICITEEFPVTWHWKDTVYNLAWEKYACIESQNDNCERYGIHHFSL